MRALLVKMSSLGDVIHALPAITDAAAHGVRFDWVVEESFADIARVHPAVERVLPIGWRRWRGDLLRSRAEMSAWLAALRGQRYQLVLDSQGLIKSALVAALARGARAGFSHTSAREPWSAFFYQHRYAVPTGQHAIDRQRQLFGAAFGYQPGHGIRSGIEWAGQRNRQVMLLHGTTWASKHYPPVLWRQLAELAATDGYQPVVTWGDDAERQRASFIAESGHAAVVDREPLQLLLQRLRSAALVIGVDSGLLHLSAALGTPTLGLFGPTDGGLTGCRGERAEFLQSAVSCSPCLARSCSAYRGEPVEWRGEPIEPPCFGSLMPQQVWHRARAMIDAHRL